MQKYIYLKRPIRSALIILLISGSLFSITPVSAQQYTPTFDFEQVLNTYFDDESGLISFQNYRVIFAPEGAFNGLVAVLDSANKIIASFPFYKEYRPKNGIYARVQVQTPADVTLTKPGIYTLVYVVDGKPVTRLPVRLELASAGKDPFNPGKKYRYDGFWRTFAFITMGTYKGEKFPLLNYWLGGKDLTAGKDRGRPFVTLYRDGKMVAHSQKTQGHFMTGHFDRAKINLYHPHKEGKEANAKAFLLNDWLVDGKYEIRVTRQSDGAMIRSFDFKVINGKFEEHPRTKFGYQPQTDYIAPRVQKKGSTILELTEAIWIQDR
jgi:hypothetical protein